MLRSVRSLAPTPVFKVDGVFGLLQVPTLDYGDKRMNESMDICKYLDTEFPDTPKLFDTASGRPAKLHMNSPMLAFYV